MWNLRPGTDEPKYRTKTDSQAWRTDLGWPRGVRGRVGWMGSLGFGGAQTIPFRMEKQ